MTAEFNWGTSLAVMIVGRANVAQRGERQDLGWESIELVETEEASVEFDIRWAIDEEALRMGMSFSHVKAINPADAYHVSIDLPINRPILETMQKFIDYMLKLELPND